MYNLQYIKDLNACTKEERIQALLKIRELIDNGVIKREKCGLANNHIHTTFSFSPYSPTMAVFKAWMSGLDTCGIVDHDSVSGCREFIEAGKILNIPVTVGMECRVKTDGTLLYGRRINNSDQKSIAYVVMHGIPVSSLDTIDRIFLPLREKRNIRNKKMCEKLNCILRDYKIHIDYEKDVLPLSEYNNGGTVTERHICMALVKKLIDLYPNTTLLVDFLQKDLNISISNRILHHIFERKKDLYEYDILSALKKNFIEKFYIDADEECMHITDFISLCKELGCISAYAYLGDVDDNSDSDKKSQEFEDSYLDILMQELKRMEFDSITYMPSRNTKEQTEAIMDYCRKYSFMEINGEDINSPRQKFILEEMKDPMYSHLKDLTYVLIGHEIATREKLNNSMFSDETKEKIPDLQDRISYYKDIAKRGLIYGN